MRKLLPAIGLAMILGHGASAETPAGDACGTLAALRIGAADIGRGLTLGHGHAGPDQPHRPGAARQQVAAGHQLVDQGLGEDDHVAGRARQQGLFHLADGAEGAGYGHAGARGKARLQAADQSVGGAAAEHVQGGLHGGLAAWVDAF
jgi:hypothetical protein